MHKCQKLAFDNSEWSSFACANSTGNVIKTTYSDSNCSNVMSTHTVTDVFDARCGTNFLGSACEYTKYSQYENCTANFSNPDGPTSTGIGDVMIKYIAMDECAFGNYSMPFGKNPLYSYQLRQCMNDSVIPSNGYQFAAFDDNQCSVFAGYSDQIPSICSLEGQFIGGPDRRRLADGEGSGQIEQECVVPWDIMSNTVQGFVFKQNEFSYFMDQCITDSATSSFIYSCNGKGIIKSVYNDAYCDTASLMKTLTVSDYDYATCGNGFASVGTADWSGMSSCSGLYSDDIVGRTVTDTCVYNQQLGVSEKWECSRNSLSHITYSDASCVIVSNLIQYIDGQCVNGKIINMHYCSADTTTTTSQPITTGDDFVPVEDNVSCPWMQMGSGGILLPADSDICYSFGEGSHFKLVCTDYGTIEQRIYGTSNCSGGVLFSQSQSNGQCQGCGPGPDAGGVWFDCSNYDQSDANDCDLVEIKQSNGCDVDGNLLEDAMVTFTVIRDICVKQQSGASSMISSCIDGISATASEYLDDACTYLNNTDPIIAGCNGNESAVITCIDSTVTTTLEPTPSPTEQTIISIVG